MPTLTWLTRDDDIKAAAAVPYRLLEAAPEHDGGGEDDRSENLLIQGDNLHALKALLPYYAGRVKCVFIDPPYNTRQDFAHYDDNLEHTQWLEMMYPRLELLRALLAEDGSIWVTVDDSEAHYLKVIMDEIFGRSNFVTNVIWNSTKSVTGTAIISVAHTNMFLYFKKMDYWVKNREEFRLVESGEGFTNPDNDPRGPWKADPFQVGGWRPNQQYEITNPTTGKVYLPKTGNSWKNDYEKFKFLMEDGRIVFGKRGTAGPQRKRFLSEAMERGRVAKTLWDDVETTTSGTRHSQKLFGEKNAFPNPKPEELIQRVLQLATAEGDWVLDSFLGSGTTAAVAHKMGRRWIGIEMGEHAVTHCIPRLQKVIDGEQGGISKAANWSGGGGFGFYRLGSEAFTADGKINPAITFPTLASHVWFSETGT
ncbi:MAG: site-specific DNA-methyltransferase, partial [Gammaproteobacteria bacterium]|nr:site-specific DNA-methyltransferase [Gammaproteobacteria bacterium]